MKEEMVKRKRLLFMGEGVTLAHVVRPLTLAKALDKNKWDVYFSCSENYKKLVIDFGLNFIPIHTINGAIFQNRVYKGAPVYTVGELEEYVKEEMEIIDKVKPDVVISDFRITLSISAQLKGVTHISLAGGQWSPYRHEPYPVPEIPAVEILGVRLAKWLIPKIMPFALKAQTKNYNSIRAKYNLPPVNMLEEVYSRGDQVLYMDIPGFYNTSELPANHRFIGPVHWDPEVKLPEWWDKIPDDKPILFITPGSSGDLKATQVLFDVMSGMPVSVMLATAGRMPHIQSSKNIYVADFLPGRQAARRSAVVVCNGGNGMVYQSLTEGTPVLGFPFNMDQYYVMEATERKGAGRLIRSGNITNKKAKAVVEEMLENPSYRTAAKQMQNKIQALDAKKEFEKELNSILHLNNSESLLAKEAVL